MKTKYQNKMKTKAMTKDEQSYLMLRDLIFQLGRLGTDGFTVDKVFLCGSEPLVQGLQSFMELLSDH